MLGKSQGANSSVSNRVFVYEVEGLRQSDQTEGNSYEIRDSSVLLKVPYSRMNEEMQRINRLGGKVVSIRPMDGTCTTQDKTRKKALRSFASNQEQLYRVRFSQSARNGSPQVRRSMSECVVGKGQLSSTLQRLTQRGNRIVDVSPA
ncbi:MAG: phycobilisome linker polypeptide [Thermosynechococcaceae cyanobacterium]